MKKVTSIANRMMEMCMHCCMCMTFRAPETHTLSISRENRHTA